MTPGSTGRPVENWFPVLALKWNPNQPRVPKGDPDGGQWTSGSAGEEGGAAPPMGSIDFGDISDELRLLRPFGITPYEREGDGVQLAGDSDRGRPVDLLEERELGGHAIERHVGRTEQSLYEAVRGAIDYARRNSDAATSLVEGSFTSLEAANKLVNATISQNQNVVEQVVDRALPRAEISAYFESPTGREAFARNERAQVVIRDTYRVEVVIVPDSRSVRGYRVETAFPSNRRRSR